MIKSSSFAILAAACVLAALCASCADDSGGHHASSSSSVTVTVSSTVTEEITSYNSSEAVDVTSWANSYAPNESSRDIISSEDDEVANVSFEGTVYVDLSNMAVSSDGSTYTQVSEGGSDVEVLDGVAASLSDGVLLIDSSEYKANLAITLSGSVSGGSVEVESAKKYSLKITMSGATIASAGYPCLNVTKASPVYLVLDGASTLVDGRSYGTGYSSEEGVGYYTSSFDGTPEEDAELTAKWAKGDDTKGTLYTKGPLLVSGSGSLTVSEGYKHGIYSKDYIRVFSGTIAVNTSGRNAIQSLNGFVMDDGTITIKGTGSYTNNESRGIIVEGSDDEDYTGEGFIVIKGGSLDITTVSKAISAKWDISEDAETSDTTDDPYPYVLITGGTIDITTTGSPKDESSSTYAVMSADGVTAEETTKLSPEGIEGKQAVFITGGLITTCCTDDAINSSRDDEGLEAQLLITGGTIWAYSTGNDAIDSNGTLTITGGVVVAVGLSSVECAFDCDDNTLSITGGLVVGVGTNNYSEPTASACSQSVVVLSGGYFGSGATFAITDTDGTPVFAFDVPSEASSSSYVMILSSPNIEAGTTYQAVRGALSSGGETFCNLYTTLPDVSGGTVTLSSVKTTTSNYVYQATSVTNFGAQEGSHTNSGPGK